MKRFLGIAALAAVLLLGGCSERLPSEPVPYNGPPDEYNGPQLGLSLNVTDGGLADVGYELIGNTFISGDSTRWEAMRFEGVPDSIATLAGHWYSEMVIRDGVPVLGGYMLAGVIPSHLWTSEDFGTFASHMVLVNDDNSAMIWQWGSNLDSLVTQTIVVINPTGHTKIGLVGTGTNFSTMPAPLTWDGNAYNGTLRTLASDCKLAVVDLDTREDVTGDVTVQINGSTLTFSTLFNHDRWSMRRYYRYHIGSNGAVSTIGEDHSGWTHGNTLSVTNQHIDPSENVWLIPEFNGNQPLPMVYVGNHTWQRSSIACWTELQNLQVVTGQGDRVFSTIQWNGVTLWHLTVLGDLVPPVQAIRFMPRYNGGVIQGDSNLTVDIDIGH